MSADLADPQAGAAESERTEARFGPPERAGAASALLGFIQQTASALCGAVVGMLLGQSAWPLVGAVAVMACASLLLWISTRAIRAHAGQVSTAE